MKCQKAERDPGGHQQLDVGKMTEDVRTIGKTEGAHDRCPPVVYQIPDQIIRADRAQHERQQDDKVVRGVGVARQPVDGGAERARHEVGFRVDERPAVREEDIGVEHVDRIVDERVGDPGHVPHRVLRIARHVQLVPDAAKVEGERIGESSGQRGKPCEGR